MVFRTTWGPASCLNPASASSQKNLCNMQTNHVFGRLFGRSMVPHMLSACGLCREPCVEMLTVKTRHFQFSVLSGGVLVRSHCQSFYKVKDVWS